MLAMQAVSVLCFGVFALAVLAIAWTILCSVAGGIWWLARRAYERDVQFCAAYRQRPVPK